MPAALWCNGVVGHILRRPIRSFVTLMLVFAVIGTTQILWHFGGSLSYRRTPRGTGSINYGVVIDAGSSGSRVHLFKWAPHDGTPSKLLNIDSVLNYMGLPLVKKSKPGISSFPTNPELAYNTLVPLLEFAMRHIPEEKHSFTPLYILGTAGMRLLSKEQQSTIIDHIQKRVAEQYPFYLPSDSVEVISGKMEGVFSWITVNYLLGQFTHHHHHNIINNGSSTELSSSTYGVLDMGGASLQIAFEIPQNIEAPQSDVVDISLGCGLPDSHHRHRVYISTYLGYGANEARNRYLTQIVQQHLNRNLTKRQNFVKDPCLPLGNQANVTVKGGVIIPLVGEGDYIACRSAVIAMLLSNHSRDDCIGKDCSVKPLQKPPFSYKTLPFYGTSEFWYTMHDVLHLGGRYQYGPFEKAAKEFCHTPWNLLTSRYNKGLYHNADFYRLRSQCFKSAWMSAVLHNGLSFPLAYSKLQSASAVNERGVQWTLGAILYLTRFFPLREIQAQNRVYNTASVKNEISRFSSIFFDPFFLPAVVVVLVVALLLLLRKHPSQCIATTRSGSFISRKRSHSLVSMAGSQSTLTSRASCAKLPLSSLKSDNSYPESTVKFFV